MATSASSVTARHSPRDTLRRHFRPFPLPKGAARHSPVTLPTLSAAQGCRATLSGDTSAPFRRPRVPRNASGELFKQFIEHRNLNMDLAGNSFCVNAVLPFQDQSQAALIINSQIFDRVHLEMIPKNLIDNLVQLILRKYNHLTDTLGNLKASVKVPHKP